MLPKIAEALDVSTEWLLQGPDTEKMTEVPPFTLAVISSDLHGSYTIRGPHDPRARAHELIESMSEKGVISAIEVLEALAARHPIDSTSRARVLLFPRMT